MTSNDQGGDHRDDDVTVIPCPSGPLLVRGPISVIKPDGTAYSPRRRTVAFCRCGRSTIAPMCDGSHKVRTRPGR
ncbi:MULTISPECIES: CDGSH iron-sulfur domain-containing protein [Gordonia]|uniref:CDGSH iron-sulfur domain-containing protein n=1 Tax=Gordonia TaxID=2053 RepID=UPI0009DA458E|nr:MULTISPECIES: CDGSH iron-sulfur domain-containing protein [Gordonia]AUH68958.1 CDGSH iron-sulfur domain-containing protein [Gordonia sp. YC-JH1]MBY4570733.1 CDGSH-type iron sulfur domain-containing protein [Gordonia sihwensis]WFN94823.1 CDGSH iron-sulfur domain-containing protein [Gordonia sihwensis]